MYNEDAGNFYIDGANLKGNYIYMDEISVTGTGNVLMAAVLVPGKTTIYNAACEPYLQQLSNMLVRMGAKIEGIGSNLLVVEGVEKLNGTTHRCLPDMIEIGSFIGMAAMTQSELTITNASVTPHAEGVRAAPVSAPVPRTTPPPSRAPRRSCQSDCRSACSGWPPFR